MPIRTTARVGSPLPPPTLTEQMEANRRQAQEDVARVRERALHAALERGEFILDETPPAEEVPATGQGWTPGPDVFSPDPAAATMETFMEVDYLEFCQAYGNPPRQVPFPFNRNINRDTISINARHHYSFLRTLSEVRALGNERARIESQRRLLERRIADSMEREGITVPTGTTRTVGDPIEAAIRRNEERVNQIRYTESDTNTYRYAMAYNDASSLLGPLPVPKPKPSYYMIRFGSFTTEVIEGKPGKEYHEYISINNRVGKWKLEFEKKEDVKIKINDKEVAVAVYQLCNVVNAKPYNEDDIEDEE